MTKTSTKSTWNQLAFLNASAVQSLTVTQDPTAHTHSLAILSLHVHEVGGVEAAVHAFLVPGDSTFNRDAARSRTKDKLFKICNID